jgi:hypothetical protein
MVVQSRLFSNSWACPIDGAFLMKISILACVAAASIAAAGCVGYQHSTTVTTPTSTTGSDALVGTWQSVSDASSSIIPDPNTCTNFKWTATSQTATSAAGSFSATCNGVDFSGFANGTLTGTTVAWGANGTASGATLPQNPCAITLTGTAQLAPSSITVPYTGSTCTGPVSGTQTLNKK